MVDPPRPPPRDAMEAAELLLALVVKLTLAFWVVLRDERRLPPGQLARAWPPVSRSSALVLAQEFAVVLHFWRTRRGARGLLVGLAFAIGIDLATSLVLTISEAVLGAVV